MICFFRIARTGALLVGKEGLLPRFISSGKKTFSVPKLSDPLLRQAWIQLSERYIIKSHKITNKKHLANEVFEYHALDLISEGPSNRRMYLMK